MTRKRVAQHYQDRMDMLLIAQAFISVLVGSVALAPDVPTYWIWCLGAVQAALVTAISITRRRLLDTPDTPAPHTDETQPAASYGAASKGEG